MLSMLMMAVMTAAMSPQEQALAQQLYLPQVKIHAQHGDVTYLSVEEPVTAGQYQCAPVDAAALPVKTEVVRASLAHLPQAALQTAGLDYVLLCSQVLAAGRPVGGIPMPPLKLLMLATGNTAGDAPRLEATTLHEFWHLAEQAAGVFTQPDWDAEYRGYRNQYGNSATRFGSGEAGFINAYAQSFPHEDRAELFALFSLYPQEVIAWLQQSGDVEVSRKLKAVMQQCQLMLSACQ